MNSFRKYQKIFGVMGITLLIASILFSIHPRRAEAIVPVSDFKAEVDLALLVEIETAGWGTYKAKEFGWDTLCWALLKAIIHEITLSIVQWINNGFQGQPGFITNPEQFLKNAGNTAASLFLENYVDPAIYDLLCTPWRAPVLSVLLTIQSGTDYSPQCTLDTIINNAEGMAKFMDKFLNGGWKSFASLTVRKENNYYGMYLSSADRMEQARAKAEDAADTEAQMNKGFIGMKVCESYNSAGSCDYWGIDSPGAWVEDQLAWTTSSEIRQLELGDEIDEILGALAGYMVKTAYKGLLGKSGGTPPSVTVPAAAIPPSAQGVVVSSIDDAITNENIYKGLLGEAISFYNQAALLYDSAINCYTTYVSDWNNCAGTRSSVDIGAITSAIGRLTGYKNTIINTTIPAIQSDIGDADINLFELSDLEARNAAATTAQELQDILTDFQTLLPSIHKIFDISSAERERDEAQALTVAPLSGSYSTANAYWHASNCPSLPAACTITGGGGGIDFQNAGGGDGGGDAGDGAAAGDF